VFFRAVMNSLPFSKRLVQAGLAAATSNCLFCGEREADSHHHAFGPCGVVREARAAVGVATGMDLGVGLAQSFLSDGSISQAGAIVRCAFVAAVWTVRTHYLAYIPVCLEGSAVVSRIVDYTICGVPVPGSEKAGETKTRNLAISPPAGVVAGYSDGSALGNPGPAGAGYVVKVDGLTVAGGAIALGMGDNNVGETAGMGALATRILAGYEDGSLTAPRALLFSDSALVIGFLCRGWAPPTNKALSRKTRKAVSDLRKRVEVDLYWVRGHAGVPGNEEADVRAKEGAAASARLEEGKQRASRRAGLRPGPRTNIPRVPSSPHNSTDTSSTSLLLQVGTDTACGGVLPPGRVRAAAAPLGRGMTRASFGAVNRAGSETPSSPGLLGSHNTLDSPSPSPCLPVGAGTACSSVRSRSDARLGSDYRSRLRFRLGVGSPPPAPCPAHNQHAPSPIPPHQQAGSWEISIGVQHPVQTWPP
jgi:ribonuclease HI